MADYFTNFSFIVPLADEAQKQSALGLSQAAGTARFNETPLPADFPESLRDSVEDWTFEVESTDEGLWFHSDSGGIDAACAFVQHLLQKFGAATVVTFEWSHDCSKPKTNAYGGGAAIVTAAEIKTLNTGDWLRANVPVAIQPQPQ